MAWRDRGLLGDVAGAPTGAPPPDAVRLLGRAVARGDGAAALRALGWRGRPDGEELELVPLPRGALARGWPAPARCARLACDGREAALSAPGAALRGARVDLGRALERGGRELALVFALLGPDSRARRRALRAPADLERELLRRAREARARGATPAAVAEALAAALAPGRGERALPAALAPLGHALPFVPLLGAPALGRVHQDLLAATGARRAQGSWFTPAPLALAVAELCLAPLRDGRDARALERLRVVDPACGSGRVLVAALDVLARAWLEAAPSPAPLVAARRALLPALEGVDRDAAAVTLARAALAAHARVPRGRVRVAPGDALVRRWRRRFDAVLGNPPWRRELGAREALAEARRSRVGDHARARTDLWMLFAHLALDLLREGGVHAFVAPGYWLRGAGPGAAHLRARLAAEARWRALVDLGRLDRFEGGGAGARAVVYAVERGATSGEVEVWSVDPTADPGALARALRAGAAPGVRRRRVAHEHARGPRGEVLLDGAAGPDARDLLARLQGRALPDGWLLSEGITANPERLGRAHVARGGLPAGARAGDPVFVLPHDVAAALPARERRLLVPWLGHDAIDRLLARPRARAPRLILATPATLPDLDRAPALARHLARFRPVLEARRETREGRRAWFHLHWPRDPRVVTGARVLVPRWTRWPSGALATEDLAVGESVWVLVPPEPAWAPLVAALAASAPFAWAVLAVSKRRGKGVDVARGALAAFPWPDAATLTAAAAVDPRAARRLARTATFADGAEALAACRAAADALARRHAEATRRHEGPWWIHPDARVRAWGEALDRAACAALGVDLARVRAAADELLAQPAGEPAAPADVRAPEVLRGEVLVSRERAWCEAGLGAECLHVDAPRARVAALRALLDPYVEVLADDDGGRAVLRLCPSVDAPSLAAVLRRAGWRIARGSEEERAWVAAPP